MGSTTVNNILSKAGVNPRYRPTELNQAQATDIVKIMQKSKIMNPPTDCLSPIGDAALRKSLKTDLAPEFITTISRPPSVYRGNPFLIEAAITYGGETESEKSVDIIRFANKVPLQYNAGACAITEAVKKIDWRRYGLAQSGGTGIPSGPATILIHMASTWIPFTSESKASIAHYGPIIKEIRLALQDCGRDLQKYLRKKHMAKRQKMRINTFVKYSKELIDPLAVITDHKKEEVKKIIDDSIKSRYGDLANGDQKE
jgi:DNA topoisomerase-6 subunit B